MNVEEPDSGQDDGNTGRIRLLASQSQSFNLTAYLFRVLNIAMNKHRFNLVLSVYFWLCIHWLIVAPYEYYSTLNIWHTIVIIYMIYMYESFWLDDTSKYITGHIMTLLEFEAYTDALVQSSVLLKFSGLHVYGPTAIDRTKDRTENTFNFKDWLDRSSRVEITSHLMKVRCRKEWIVWSDKEGSYHYQREEFIKLHELAYHRHSNQYSEKIVFKHALFYPCVLVCSSRDQLPYLLRVKSVRGMVYYLCLFSGVSWFFRVWLDSVAKNADLRINKAIKFD